MAPADLHLISQGGREVALRDLLPAVYPDREQGLRRRLAEAHTAAALAN